MFYFAVLLMLVCSFLITAAQYLFKKIMMETLPSRSLSMLRRIGFWVGILLYIVYFLLSVVAYQHGDMMVLFPIVNLCLIWNIVVALRFLGERMNAWKYAGTALIFSGSIILLF